MGNKAHGYVGADSRNTREDEDTDIRELAKIRLEDLQAEEFVRELTKQFEEHAKAAQQGEKKADLSGDKSEEVVSEQSQSDATVGKDFQHVTEGNQPEKSFMQRLLRFLRHDYEEIGQDETLAEGHAISREKRKKKLLTEALMSLLSKFLRSNRNSLEDLINAQIRELKHALDIEQDPKMRHIFEQRLTLLNQLVLQLMITRGKAMAETNLFLNALMNSAIAMNTLDVYKQGLSDTLLVGAQAAAAVQEGRILDMGGNFPGAGMIRGSDMVSVAAAAAMFREAMRELTAGHSSEVAAQNLPAAEQQKILRNGVLAEPEASQASLAMMTVGAYAANGFPANTHNIMSLFDSVVRAVANHVLAAMNAMTRPTHTMNASEAAIYTRTNPTAVRGIGIAEVGAGSQNLSRQSENAPTHERTPSRERKATADTPAPKQEARPNNLTQDIVRAMREAQEARMCVVEGVKRSHASYENNEVRMEQSEYVQVCASSKVISENGVERTQSASATVRVTTTEVQQGVNGPSTQLTSITIDCTSQQITGNPAICK